MVRKFIHFLSKYHYGLLAIGIVTLVQFLPYYLEERRLLQGYSEQTTGTVLSLKRNIFDNAGPAHSEEEKSCTLSYRYQVADQEYRNRYLHYCAELRPLAEAGQLTLLYDKRRPKIAKPSVIILNVRWLAFGSGIGSVFFALGVVGVGGRFLSNDRTSR